MCGVASRITSKSSIGGLLFYFVLFPLVANEKPPDSTFAPVPSFNSGIDRIEPESVFISRLALEKPVNVDFRETPFREVLDFIRKQSGMNVVLQSGKLNANAEAQLARKVSLQLKDTPIVDVLCLVLESIDLNFIVQDRLILIGRKTASTSVYPVADLTFIASRDGKATYESTFIGTLADTVGAQWSHSDGFGDLDFEPTTCSYSVTHSEATHRNIQLLLSLLRQAKRQLPAHAKATGLNLGEYFDAYNYRWNDRWTLDVRLREGGNEIQQVLIGPSQSQLAIRLSNGSKESRRVANVAAPLQLAPNSKETSEGAPKSEPAAATPGNLEMRIVEPRNRPLINALETKISVDFKAVPFDKAVAVLREKAGVNIAFLPNQRIALTDAVATVQLKDAPLAAVIESMFKGFDYTYSLRHGAIVIASESVENRSLSVYPIVDFFKHRSTSTFIYGLTPLTVSLQGLVEKWAYDAKFTEADSVMIVQDHGSMSLVLRSTESMHRDVAAILSLSREAGSMFPDRPSARQFPKDAAGYPQTADMNFTLDIRDLQALSRNSVGVSASISKGQRHWKSSTRLQFEAAPNRDAGNDRKNDSETK